MKVLGLDPGTLKMGYAVLCFEKSQIKPLVCSYLQFSASKSLEFRFYEMDRQLDKIFKKYKPEHTAIEKVFLGKNPQSAFKLGQAFGIGLLGACKWSSKVFEYSSRTIKKTVSGRGSCGKENIRAFINHFLKIDIKSLDACDAAAAALCHIHHYRTQKILKKVV